MTDGVFQGGGVIDGLYLVQDIIGQGGMGAVFHVTHLEWNMDLAIKMPLPQLLQDKEQFERFVREAETWIDLGVHPNIVQLYYVGIHDGMPMLFLDYLTGGSLKDWLKDGYIVPGDWPTILDLVIQAVDGLAYAHSRGVIHRDVKPANLLVRGADRVCVTDFGIVKTLDGPVPEGGNLPAAASEEISMAGGTAEYAAPEQWDGVVSPLVDIYAIGVILYEFCTGRRPFLGKSEKPTRLELIIAHRTEFAAPPIELRPDLPQPLNDVIMACMDKNPAGRPQSMTQLREYLAQTYHHLTGTPYPREIPKPSEQRADALNNRAVSLMSLGKAEEALDAWRQACQADARHPQAVYNRAIAQWRHGHLPDQEVYQRLKLAQAQVQLGYFLIESGRGEQAVKMLQQAAADPELGQQGTTHRALGDALMYADSFFAADKAYAQALHTMPKDKATLLRRRLARLGVREMDEGIYFPKSGPVSTFQQPGPILELHVDRTTGAIFVAGSGWLECWDPNLRRLAWTVPLPPQVPRFDSDSQRVYALDVGPPRAWRMDSGELLWQGSDDTRLLAISHRAQIGVVGGSASWTFSLKTGAPVAALAGLAGELVCAAFSDDGEKLVGADALGNLSVWNSGSGELTSTFPAHQGPVNKLQLLQKGRLGVTSGADEAIRFWELAASKAVIEMTGQTGLVEAELDESGKFLLTRFHNGSFSLWEMGKHRVLEGSGPTAFVPGGLLYEREGQVAYWSFADGWIRRRWPQHNVQLTCFIHDLGARHVITGSQEGLLQWWHFDEPHRVFEKELLLTRSDSHAQAESTRQAFDEHISKAEALLSEQPESAYKALTAARNVKGYVRDPRALAVLARLYRSFARVGLKDLWERQALTLQSPSKQLRLFGEVLVSLGFDGRLEVVSGGRSRYLSLTDLNCLDRPRQAEHLVVGSADGTVSSRDLAGALIGGAVDLGSPPVALCCDGSGRYAAVATEDGQLHLVDLHEANVLLSMPDQDAPNRLLSVAPDLSRGLSGPKLRYWDLLAGRSLEGRSKFPAATALDISDDGRWALTANEENLIELWMLQGGRSCRKFKGHTDTIVAVGLWEFLGVAVSAGADGNMVYWDITDGTVIKRLHSKQPIVAGWVGPNGRFLVTASADQVVKVWEAEWQVALDRSPVSLDEVFGSKSTMGKLGALFRRR